MSAGGGRAGSGEEVLLDLSRLVVMLVMVGGRKDRMGLYYSGLYNGLLGWIIYVPYLLVNGRCSICVKETRQPTNPCVEKWRGRTKDRGKWPSQVGVLPTALHCTLEYYCIITILVDVEKATPMQQAGPPLMLDTGCWWVFLFLSLFSFFLCVY